MRGMKTLLALALTLALLVTGLAGCGATASGKKPLATQGPTGTPTFIPHPAPVGYYFGSGDGTVYAIDAANQSTRWTFKADSSSEVATEQDGVVYATSYNPSEVYALDALTGVLRWKFTSQGNFGLFSVSDGHVYLGGSGGVTALDAASGKQLWQQPAPGFTGRILVAGGVVFAYATPAILAFNATDGTKMWTYTASDTNTEVYPTKDAVYAVDRNVTAVAPASGKQLWQTSTGDAYGRVDLVSGSTLYVRASRSNEPPRGGAMEYYGDELLALSADSGNIQWRHAFPGQMTALEASGDRVLTMVGRALYALDAVSGVTRWTFAAQSGGNTILPSATGMVYLGVPGSGVYALDVQSGAQQWSVQLLAATYLTLVDVGGVLYASRLAIGDETIDITALDKTTGAQRSRYLNSSVVALNTPFVNVVIA